jgi:hypothetical protein
MYKEPSSTETVKKPEAQENLEAPRSAESPEEVCARMTSEAEKETANFVKECAGDPLFIEKQEEDGVKIDPEDKSELSGTPQEADAAKVELMNEIGDKTDQKNKYADFAKDQRKFYGENEMNTLEEAQRGKKYALSDMESTQESIDENLAKIETLRLEIESKKSSIINRILEFRKIRDLEIKLRRQENLLADYGKRLEQKKELAEAYDYLIGEETKLADSMEEANRENAEFDNKKQEAFLEEERNRDIKNLVKKHGVFFVHDIVDAEWKPSANNRSIDTKQLDFYDQLDILHGLEPTISTSTLHEDSRQNTFGEYSFGVLLSGGRVLGGDRSDTGSVAIDRNNRYIPKENRTPKAIENAILRKTFASENKNVKDSTDYNELVVENPEIAGVCVKWSEEWSEGVSLAEGSEIVLSKKLHGEKDSYEHWWSKVSGIMQRGLPIFILSRDNNTVRMMYDINIKNKSFKVTPQFSPENFANMPGSYQQHLGKEEKRNAAMRVFDKAVGLLTEEEKNAYVPDGTEKDGRGLYNVN